MGYQDHLLEKAPTGIAGFDTIVGGGLPKGRTTLICGGPGSGKTLMSIEFLVRGAQEFGEPGVMLAFEETEEDLVKDVASLGIDLASLIEQDQVFVDYVSVDRSEIEETGEYNLDGLFIRLEAAVRSIGAKRVVLDTIETIFSSFSDEAILRSEIRRLFRWTNQRGLTLVVTGERGENTLTRYGLEEYISDCVILLENRVVNKISSRVLRVLKYRGSRHGTDEYPFLIGDNGLWVQPITSRGLHYPISSERISTGVAALDQMLGGMGFYRGSSVLISGTAGTGKTSLVASLVDAACRRGERCLYLAFEESPEQIIRNMGSIGMDLQPWVDQGLLHFQANRPTFYGIEMHLLTIQKEVEQSHPSVVVFDPLTNLTSVGSESEVKSMLVRLIDFLKMKLVTAVFTSLTSGGSEEISSEVGVSSLMDAWIILRSVESNGERNRMLSVLKARGMAHSSQVREFVLTDRGIDLVDVVVNAHGVLVGSARAAHFARERALAEQRRADMLQKERESARRRLVLESKIAELKAEILREEESLQQEIAFLEEHHQRLADEVRSVVAARQEFGSPGGTENG